MDSTTINNQVYLAVANHGSAGRYEAFSRVYAMDNSGQLSVVQNIPTQGASAVKFFHPSGSADSYLIMANQRNNAGQTRLQSKVGCTTEYATESAVEFAVGMLVLLLAA